MSAIIAAVPPVYVTGHRNPDTDSIASAIGYAELKGRLDPNNEYVPVRLGENAQRVRLLMAVADLPEQRQRPGDGLAGLLGLALLDVQRAQVGQRGPLAAG